MTKGPSQQLPHLTDAASFRAFRSASAQWLPIALDIARSHGLDAGSPQVFATGTNLVVGLGDTLILKIFPPLLAAQFASERASLTQLAGRLHLPIPEIVADGMRDGWPYLVITRLAGTLGSEVWPSLPERQKERLLRQIGEIIASVQRVPLGELASIEPRWDAFMHAQMQGCKARHTRLGLAPKFLAGLDDLLRDAAKLIPMDAPPVILIGEYIPENFLLACDDGQWSLAGLFDFGDVLTGWRDYDLLGPSAFMAAGRPGRVRSLLDGFGYAKLDFALKRRLMALMLLHRASDLNSHICVEGWQERANDLVELQELIWPG
ncbi:aminoglycoside 3'-phosphotransferase/choline kinase family protein [Bradyrhizobium sp. 180]|uniref:aminoglycoside phosphotransferase family protein n=1 Tax=unclassified Bradyrhizobium TaxID=2631580 RepID=UPI001FF89240|nr:MULTISPECIES: aminoglycoside 3'-phosphotransferase/choline kinase family protein [unclassified Bradyrhizobium]MCK1425570.1 aminoglycoside 3'-phosphotransferase/choline kinase family protein [Bradyrhizobium sp. CW12]MCK1494020.1 aminoglycoside 3'-phosphotransferase/choline kinase family protein [Bradyrhizobium sp. 180]MCK1532127.1 aminoglycoside 3'-phosphotransferase/choline kinase family protein [Bradyrhizobium sp. 182]MCK1594462.1 aminoglycoside 3'-phosphotransferase/choline kinase family p